jgi:uncharacterized cupin superfamily protein
VESVPTIHSSNANSMPLPPHAPKPTSLDGQTESIASIWKSKDGSVETGVWECTPGTFTATRDGYDEVAHVVSGSATVTSGSGDVVSLVPGSTLVTPAGWTGSWTVHETMRKIYVVRTVS